MPGTPDKSRTISYLRAGWMRPPDMSLQVALRAALDSLPTTFDTRLPLRDMEAEVLHRRPRRRSLSMHIAAWTDREPASTVPHAPNAAESDLNERRPGRNWDYLDGDGMVFVSDDHCLLMPSGLHPRLLERYLQNLLAYARDECDAPIPDHFETFELMPVADEAIVRRMRRQGVKRIHMNLGQYLETARDDDAPIVQRLGRAVFETLLTREEDRRRIQEAENVNARLVITCDGRRSGIEPEDLVPLAGQLAEESQDDIQIETGTGEKIRRGEVLLRKSVEVAASAKTVHYRAAWEAMERYFRELRDGGMLEE